MLARETYDAFCGNMYTGWSPFEFLIQLEISSALDFSSICTNVFCYWHLFRSTLHHVAAHVHRLYTPITFTTVDGVVNRAYCTRSCQCFVITVCVCVYLQRSYEWNKHQLFKYCRSKMKSCGAECSSKICKTDFHLVLQLIA